jgi:flagellar hook assembly protein FlgD
MEIPPISFFQPAFPNPFSTQVTFSVELTNGTDLYIDIFDLLGRKVKTLYGTGLMPGIKYLSWDGKNDLGEKLSNGMYFAQPDKNSNLEMVKLVMMKN